MKLYLLKCMQLTTSVMAISYMYSINYTHNINYIPTHVYYTKCKYYVHLSLANITIIIIIKFLPNMVMPCTCCLFVL